MRTIVNIANGLEDNTSVHFSNRTGLKTDAMIEEITEVQRIQQKLQLSSKMRANSYHQALQTKLPLVQLDEEGEMYSTNRTHQFMVNVLIAKLQELLALQNSNLQGRLNVQTLSPTSAPFAPTHEEHLVFFTIMNTNEGMR